MTSITHRQWMALAAEEHRRIGELLAGLTPDDWDRPTDCAGWTVRDILAHLIGAAEATASVREQLRQQRLGGKRRGDRLQIDAVNEIQVHERAGLDPAELCRQLADAGPRGLRARTRLPAPIRALRFPFPPPVGWASLGHLYDTVHTRDAWMHRVDICRATKTPCELTADHDAVIIGDAARAWLRATGTSGLTLTGPAGGSFANPADGPTHDAVDFARALSGRGQLPGVRPDIVLF